MRRAAPCLNGGCLFKHAETSLWLLKAIHGFQTAGSRCRMRIWGKLLLCCLLFLIHVPGFADTSILYPFDTVKQEVQYHHLLKELRCLVCQNQDLADSNAGLAKDLRDEVYAFVQAGKSDNEIIDYLTDRYGDFILFKPPVKAITALLWFGPTLFMLVGLLIFWYTLRRTRHE